ncbi:MAG TPA: maleylpyruvate isomerase N-terminal domain-containing protein [Candidatus Saccharimonadales bacterium]|nr:maleylpyruvate isomerase N-terminal domain-containing protein [Candidatus Saccharimonadales bacterium]
MSDAARARLIAHLRDVQQRWRGLAADVGKERMEQPGAMGDWTFKDVASHLTGWRRRTILRLRAAAAGEPEPPNPWPAELGDAEDDVINAWMHDRTKDDRLDAVLAEADGVYDDFIAVVETLPAELLTDPDRFGWMEGVALADGDFSGHLDEHEPDVRRWLARA